MVLYDTKTNLFGPKLLTLVFSIVTFDQIELWVSQSWFNFSDWQSNLTTEYLPFSTIFDIMIMRVIKILLHLIGYIWFY